MWLGAGAGRRGLITAASRLASNNDRSASVHWGRAKDWWTSVGKEQSAEALSSPNCHASADWLISPVIHLHACAAIHRVKCKNIWGRGTGADTRLSSLQHRPWHKAPTEDTAVSITLTRVLWITSAINESSLLCAAGRTLKPNRALHAFTVSF